MTNWETAWEVGFAGGTPKELLLALTVRDLLHGASFDVELEGTDTVLAVDLYAGDELQDDTYQLLLAAEVEGEEDSESLQAFIESLLEETVAEAEDLVARGRKLGSRARSELGFERVAEDEERWDLVVPDWLAPDGAEVPFGFRPVDARSREPWPTDDQLAEHGRVVVVPTGELVELYGIPAPEPQDD